MRKSFLFLLCFAGLVPAALGQGGGGGASGGGGSGGGGGGSSTYSFRYLFLSKSPFKAGKSTDRTIAPAYTKVGAKGQAGHYYTGSYYKTIYFFQGLLNDLLLGVLKISRTDSVMRQIHHPTRRVTSNQYYVQDGDTTRIMTASTGDSISYQSHHILYAQIAPYHRLPFYILGRNQDTLMVEVWPPTRRLQNNNFDVHSTVISGVQNGKLYNHDKVVADTFYVVIPWRNQGVGPRFQTFNLLFGTKYLIAVTAPIGYTFGAKAWQTNFFNAGIAYGWGKGRTKFYRDNLQTARNFYWGAGFIAGVSSLSMSPTVNPKANGMYSLPGVYSGLHAGVSFNSVQLMVTGAYEWAIGSNSSTWLYQGKFTLGLAIGLSGFNLTVPASASAPLTH